MTTDVDAPARPVQVDPRGPRFGAAITATLLLIAVALSLLAGTATEPSALLSKSAPARLSEPAAILLFAIFLLFIWGATAGIRRHPFGVLFTRLIRPRLNAPAEFEPAAPPTFAQGVGAFVVGLGLLLHVLGVPFALPIAAAAAFVAAFLNAAFAFCLGCELYLLLRRLSRAGRPVPTG